MDIKPKNLLKRVLQFAREELDRRNRTDEPSKSPGAEQPAASTPHLGFSEREAAPADALVVRGLEVARAPNGHALTLRWSVSEREVTRAQGLISGNPVLCVRLVSFTKLRDDVLREVQDRPGVELSGQCEIGEPAQRAVVSLGLRAGDRFVSIAHHVL
jgi:hypothetical protein